MCLFFSLYNNHILFDTYTIKIDQLTCNLYTTSQFDMSSLVGCQPHHCADGKDSLLTLHLYCQAYLHSNSKIYIGQVYLIIYYQYLFSNSLTFHTVENPSYFFNYFMASISNDLSLLGCRFVLMNIDISYRHILISSIVYPVRLWTF